MSILNVYGFPWVTRFGNGGMQIRKGLDNKGSWEHSGWEPELVNVRRCFPCLSNVRSLAVIMNINEQISILALGDWQLQPSCWYLSAWNET